MTESHIYERSNMRNARIMASASNEYYEVSTNFGNVIEMSNMLSDLGFQVTESIASTFYGYVRVMGRWDDDNVLVWDEGVPPQDVDPEVCTLKIEQLDGVLKIRKISHKDYVAVLNHTRKISKKILGS